MNVCPAGGDWGAEEILFPNNARNDWGHRHGVGDPFRTSAPARTVPLAYHVLEVMCAFDKSSETGEHVVIESTTERPEPVPTGLKEWEMD